MNNITELFIYIGSLSHSSRRMFAEHIINKLHRRYHIEDVNIADDIIVEYSNENLFITVNGILSYRCFRYVDDQMFIKDTNKSLIIQFSVISIEIKELLRRIKVNNILNGDN